MVDGPTKRAMLVTDMDRGRSIHVRLISSRQAYVCAYVPVPVVLYILLWMHDHLAKPRSIIKKVQHRMRDSDEKAADESGKQEQETSASDGESSDGGLGVRIYVQEIAFDHKPEDVDESDKVEPLLAKLWSPKVAVTKAGKLQHGYLQACQSVSIEGDIDSI
ncbi:unnamed protein product [Symbiodinium sp. KB8]|nr:unnamed protein product [Symbiodinium sp. KB8]